VAIPPPGACLNTYVDWDAQANCYRVTWDTVVKDMEGTPITIPFFRIFRGSAPDFRPDVKNGTNQIGQGQWEYCDPVPYGSTYYYIAMATDGMGNTGPF